MGPRSVNVFLDATNGQDSNTMLNHYDYIVAIEFEIMALDFATS